MKTSRKATLFLLIALICASSQVVSHAAKVEPEIASALDVCSSLDQFTRWISDLSGETEALIHGKPHYILTRYALADDARTSEQYLREQFYAMGLEVETQMVFPEFSRNLIARLPGITRPEDVVIICAHYDSTSEDPLTRAPGADDNASGTAGVLTAASILRNFRFECSVEFCLFTAEEFGLYGSEAYAAECLAAGKNVVAVLNMDMIIHSTNDVQSLLPLDVDIVTNSASETLAASIKSSIERYTPLDAEVTVDAVRGSDHASFWDIGSPAVAVAENLPSEIWSGSTSVYHTTDDLITQPNVDLPFGLSVARGIAAATMIQAHWERPRSLPFGVASSAVVDGINRSDGGEHRAFMSVGEESGTDGAFAECRAENLVLQGAVGPGPAVSTRPSVIPPLLRRSFPAPPLFRKEKRSLWS